MSKSKEIIEKDDVTQAVLIADNFNDEFAPLTNEGPLALLPLVNRPLVEYSLEFLALARIEETFLFCCRHADSIKEFVRKSIESKAVWTQTMHVNIIVSESCRSFGDCMRDLDAKGLIRGNFVLVEAGAISNMKLLPIMNTHGDILKKDKTAAMTLIYEKAGSGRNPREEILLATNGQNRILFHRRPKLIKEKKIDFPLEIFLENPKISIQHNLRDTHISICSPSVLPLFSDNFDYQTRDDFIRGLLMVDEILDATLYQYIIKGDQHSGIVNDWSSYKSTSQELIDRWFYPIVPTAKKTRVLGSSMIQGRNCTILEKESVVRSVLGDNVKVGSGTLIEDSTILSNVKIEENCVITHSFLGSDVKVGKNSKIQFGSIIGNGVVLEMGSEVRDAFVQSKESKDMERKLGPKAYKIKPPHEEDTEGHLPDTKTVKSISRLHLYEAPEESESEDCESSDSEGELSYTTSPVPDDTNLFYTEVTDSLARGFEDKLQCDNLILEINSSRYAYNVTLKEVHYNVVKALLNLPFQQSTGQPYLQALCRSLVYFSPILKNYIRNEDAMVDCLQSIEDVAASNNELNDCITKVLNWFYDKDHLTEEALLNWYSQLDATSRLRVKVTPFIDWLREAEEASTDGDESE